MKECPEYILANGTKVVTNAKLDSTSGFIVSPKHLDVRRPNQRGTIAGVVGGHGGDVYWVKHDDRPEEVGAYGWSEFELAVALAIPAPRYTCGQCCFATERFRAKDNAGEHAHLCRECARILDEKFLRDHYADLGAP